MSGGDIEVLKAGIANLLSGVETAFVTSLVGISCALIYTVAHHLLMKNFRQKLAQLSARLDEIFPRRPAEDWLAKSFAEQQIHTTTLQKLVDAIDKFTSGGSDKVGEVFTQKVGTQMENFSTALNKFTEAINDKLINALKDHATQTKTSADNFNATVDSQRKLLETVTNNNVTQINGAITAFRNTVTEQKDLLTTVTNNNAAQINEAVGKFNATVDTNKEILDQIQQMLQSSEKFLRAVNASGTALNQSADALLRANGQLLTKLPELTTQMSNLLKANQFTRENLNTLSTQVTTFVKNFNGIAEELERAVNLIRDALEHYNEVTNDGLQKKLDMFDKSMSAAVGYLKELVEELNDALEAKLQLGICN